MNDVQEFLTPEKFEELKKELEHLKTTRRKEVAESLEYARSLGDLSENAEYQEARDMQAAIEERIQHLEQVIKEAKIVAHDKKGGVVGLGSAVSIQKTGKIHLVTPSWVLKKLISTNINFHTFHHSVKRLWVKLRETRFNLILRAGNRVTKS